MAVVLRCLFVATALLFLEACPSDLRGPGLENREPSDISPDESGGYPHPAGWDNPASHGAWAVQFDPAVCLKCHMADPGGEESRTACFTCHPMFPHEDGWVGEGKHGDEVRNNGQGACATLCHGADLQGGLSGVSCDLCHTTYPHPPAWAQAAQHGVEAKGSGKTRCQPCHGADLQGGESGVSCYQCHALYPHDADWEKPDQHGSVAIAAGSDACASQCHGTDLKGGLSGVACGSCHDLYPHPDGWEDQHGSTVLAVGTSACQACHGADLSAPLDGKNCFSCHDDYPHPLPSSWLPYAGGHGEKVQSDYSGSTVPCQICHGADLKKVKADGKNCFSCHPTYPHNKFSSIAWGTYGGHGQYTLPSSKRPECQLCHGTDYKGGARSNPSCFSCHATYPHVQPGWLRPPGQSQEHGNYVVAHTSASCATSRCHGVGLVPSAITNGPSCTSCHASYPHAPGWPSGLVHGPVALANISVCKDCHGAGLNFAMPGYQSCQQCHPSYLRHESADLGVTNWDTYAGHGQYVMNPPLSGDASSCKICHGNDYRGGISHVSCKSCHASYPHDAAGWETETGHGVYIKAALGGNLTSCKVCHGNDYLGGISHVSCKSCHASYPHDAADWETGTGHGAYVETTLGGDLTACKACHGSDLKGGTSGVSCNTCHANYPHSVIPGWSGTGHGSQSDTPAEREACKTCHGTDLLGGTSGVSCKSCHATYPHDAAGWSAGTGHGSYVKTTLSGVLTTCQLCHGADLSGGHSGVSCFTCHPDYPHSVIPGWSGLGHGSKSDTPAEREACKTCHGTDLLGGTSGVSCKSCHATYPHDAAGWSAGTGHGVHVKTTLSGDLTSCKVCHGADLQGGHSGVSCFSCHADYPHSVIAGWATTAHGPKADTPVEREACKACHGTDLLGGTSGVSCKSCHTEFPHSPEWVAKEVETTTGSGTCCNPDDETDCWSCTWTTSVDRMFLHGRKFVEQKQGGFVDTPNRCSNCHGGDYGKFLNGKNCMSCHPGYPHVKYANWVDLPTATPIGGQHTPSFLAGATGLTSPCTACHPNFGTGLEPLGLAGAGLNADACSSCHEAYPHVRLSLSPDSWIYRAGVPPSTPHSWKYNHGWYSVLESYKEAHSGDTNMCKICHGADLLGISGVAKEAKRCSRCHTTGVVSHSVPSWRPAAGHGKNYLRARLAGFPSGNPDRCHDCHSPDHNRSPKVCNPFTVEFPGSGADWCSTCHIPNPPVPGMCPCPGMNPVTGVCP
ncbi:MAG TPA: hypothetical protein VLJ37_12385 [bacterium]|nr:hypothetical protein [bacterium]